MASGLGDLLCVWSCWRSVGFCGFSVVEVLSWVCDFLCVAGVLFVLSGFWGQVYLFHMLFSLAIQKYPVLTASNLSCCWALQFKGERELLNRVQS